jgi:hypothetical protein
MFFFFFIIEPAIVAACCTSLFHPLFVMADMNDYLFNFYFSLFVPNNSPSEKDVWAFYEKEHNFNTFDEEEIKKELKRWSKRKFNQKKESLVDEDEEVCVVKKVGFYVLLLLYIKMY